MCAQPFTPHEDVNAILQVLLDELKGILKEQFFGMYLFGSLACGGFDKDSDIDVFIATDGEIGESVFLELQSMQKRIAKLDSPWAMQLEVTYLPKNNLRHYAADDKNYPQVERGADELLLQKLHKSDWIILRHSLYEHGITVEGPDIRAVIDPVTPGELQEAAVSIFAYPATPILEDPFRELKRRGYQSFIVLTFCRILYTLQHGTIAPKPVAAEWALKNLPGEWCPLIERALIGRQTPDLAAEVADINGTVAFLHFTQSEIEQFKRR